MDKPEIAANRPKKVELKAGKKYAYCTFGLSANQPFCDGKHSGTDFRPALFVVEEDQVKHLCQCKQTANLPYCDGSHKNVDVR